MPSPAVTNEPLLSKPPEKHLSEALRETFQNLDIKDVTPDVIIRRFSKSGGIDRVRIAIERRMKQYQEAQKRHTVAASEQFLNQALPDHSEGPPPQKLMQQAQDFVLATVKDRIGRDVDSVTEQSKADWFFECVRDEIINACKEDDTAAETEEEPAPSTNVVDGAKAILKNLTRNVARARQIDHLLDPAKMSSKKEHYANGHIVSAMNGKLGDDLKQQSEANKRQGRSKTTGVGPKEVESVEGTADNDRKENVNPPRSPEGKAAPRPPGVSEQDRPPSAQTPTIKNAEKATAAPEAKTKVKGETNPIPSKQHEKDYEALADDLLLGDSDGDVMMQNESEAVKKPVLTSSSGYDDTSDKKAKAQTENTVAAQKESLAKQSEGSVIPPQTPETNREKEMTDPVVELKDSAANVNTSLNKTSTSESPEVSDKEVDSQAAMADRSSVKEKASVKEQLADRKHVLEGKPFAERNLSAAQEPSTEQQHSTEQALSAEPRSPAEQTPSAGQRPSTEQRSSAEQNNSIEPKPSTKQQASAEQTPSTDKKPSAERKPSAKQEPSTGQKPPMEGKPSGKEERMAGEDKTASIPQMHEDDKKLDDQLIRERATNESKVALRVSHVQDNVVESVQGVKQEFIIQKRTKGDGDVKCDKEDDRVAQMKSAKLEDEGNGAVEGSRDTASEMTITRGNTDEKEESHSPSKDYTEDTTRHQSKSGRKILSSHEHRDAKEILAPSKSKGDEQPDSGREEIPNSTRNEKGFKPKDNEKSEQSDGDLHVRSEARSPTRRTSRRRSTRMMPEEEADASALAQTTKDTKTQMTTVANKEKRPRGRSKRKPDVSTGRQPEGKRKAAKNDTSKHRSELNEKKRRRSQAADQGVLVPTQPSDARPDPEVENWPRGYGIEMSCVPEDYDAQQKVLHALTMLLEKDHAAPFSEPVDPSVKGLEMYASVIRNPMDLGEICERLQNSSAERGYYLSVCEILQDIELVWWNCRRYNGKFDPIIHDCERSQLQLSFLLEQHGIQMEKGGQKRRRVLRASAASTQLPEEEAAVGDNDGRLVGKKILIFTELKKKKKKEWFSVEVKAYDSRSKSYTLLWLDEGKTTKKATFGGDKMYPVYRA